ncbi:Uncharacterised protein [Candidatus Burarchaeum australiense]|nr:Uncharacterised protein [Candidatus Burarchaeum australiense]
MFFALALLISLSCAQEFNFNPYFYSGENSSSVTLTSIGGGYDLATINGQETFVLFENQIVEDQDAIRGALKNYYTTTALPSSAEVDELILLAKAFNETRNLATPYGGGSEDVCVGASYLSMFKGTSLGSKTPSIFCYDYESCSYLPPISGVMEMNNIPWFVEAKTVHGQTLFALDNNFTEFETNLLDITPDTAGTNLQAAMGNLEGMKTSAHFLKNSALQLSSMFGGPCNPAMFDSKYLEKLRDAAPPQEIGILLSVFPVPGCMDVCPGVTINESKMDETIAKAQLLLDKAMPLVNLETETEAILAKTNERKTYLSNMENRKVYLAEYANVTAKLANMHRLTNVTALRYAVQNDLTTLDALSVQINNSIELQNFELTEVLMGQFRDRGKVLESRLGTLVPTYSKADAARARADQELLRAQFNTAENEADALKELGTYKQMKASLDGKFRSTSYLNDFPVLEVNYTGLADNVENFNNNLNNLHSAQISTVLSSATRGAMKNTLSLWNGISPMTPTQMRENAKVMPTLLIGAADVLVVVLSLGVFAVFAFVTKRITWRREVKLTWVAIFLVFFAIVGAASLGLHQLITSQADQPTSFGLFYSGLAASNVSAISYDTSNLTQSQVFALQSCAKQISSKLKADNIAVKNYIMSGNSCRVGSESKSVEDCNNELSEMPVFTLKFGTKNSVSFRTFYEYTATVEGDTNYMGQCDMAKVL